MLSRSMLGVACAATLFSASASAITVNWVDGTGFWDIVGNWSPSQLPATGDDVVINVAGQQTITHRTGNTTIRSIANTGDEIVAITNGSSLTVSANSLTPSTNTGTLRVTGTGSRLRFQGSTLNNAGGTLDAQDGSLVELLQGTIVGGTLTTSGSGVIRAVSGSYGTLDGVTLNGTYLVGDGSGNSNSYLRNSLVNNGVVALSSGTVGLLATLLLLDGDVTVSGTGSITLSESTANWLRGNGGTERLTNAAGHTIQGAGTISTLSITNRGTISATHATPLIVQPSGTGSVLNTGSLQATSGGVLRLQAGTFTNFEGSSNGTIQAFDNSVVEFAEGSNVVGGILSTTGTGLLRSRPGTTSTLDGVTLNGNYVAGDGSANTRTRLLNTITNNGTFTLGSGLNGTLSADLLLNGTDATLAGTGTLAMTNSAGNRISGNFNTERLTNSAGHTIQGSGNVGAATMALTNQGLIVANQSTPLIVQPNSSGVINTGSLRADGGTLDLRGLFTNTGGSLEARNGSVLQLSNATVVGGTLRSSNGGVLRTAPGTLGRLDGVTLEGTYVAGDGSSNTTTQLVGTITNLGTLAMNSGVGGGLTTNLVLFQSDVTLSGTGTLAMASATNNIISGQNNNERLTNSPGHTIAGGGNIGNARMTLTNQGLIVATQATPLVIQPNSSGVINTGTLRADGGTLELRGLFTNTGGAIVAVNGSVAQLAGATVVGGTLSADPSSVIRTTPGTLGRLDGVTLEGTYVAGDGSSNTTTQLVGTITNNGTLAMNSGVGGGLTTNLVLFQSDVTLSGTGTLAMGNNANNVIDGANNNERLTNGPGHTIAGSGNIGNARMTLTNQGLIVATQATPLIVQPNSSGVINTGTLRADGGTLELRGLFTSTGGTIDARNGSTAQLGNATVVGGTLTTSTGGVIRTRPGTVGQLDGVTLNGTYVAGDGSSNTTTRLVGTITNNGTLAMNSGVGGDLTTSLVLFQSDVTLAGSGTLAMSNRANNVINDVNGNETLTNTAAHTIQGAGQILVNLQNAGTVRATGSAGLLANRGIVGPTGTIEIASDGSLRIAAPSSAGSLLHNGTTADSLALGTNSITVHGDYNNASFGTGNAFNPRANVTGTGQILAAGNTAQAITGAGVSNGATATPTLTLNNVRIGTNTFSFQVANTGTTGPSLRGAIQTTVNGGNITDPRLSVTPQNFGPLAPGTASGSVNVDFNVTTAGPIAALTGQAIHVTNNFGNVADQTIGLVLGANAAAYVPAIGQLNTAALNFGTVQVGQNVSQTLSISNIASGPLGYVEDLNAAFGAATGVGASLITGTGSINGLLAGATNASNMVVSVNTSAAGTVNGAIPVNFFTAGAVNGVSNGLGTAAVGSANFGVAGTIQTVVQVVDQAIPVINNPVIDLGNIRIGSASPTSFVSVTNQSTGNAQAALNASISASAPVTASGAFNGLAPGATNSSSLLVGIDTATAGARSGTASVAFVSDASNVGNCAPNCQVTLASQNVTVQGNVFRLANPVVGTPGVTLAARVGDAAPTAAVSVTNSSPDAYTEGLNAAIATSAAGFTASGTVTNLVAGATDGSNLRVGLSTATAGTFTGTAGLTLASTGAGTTGATDLALPGQAVDLTGRVFTPAVAAVANPTVDFGIVHVGDSVTRNVTVSNVAPVTALNDVLRGSIGGATGAFTASGSLGDGLAAGQSDASSLTVGLNTGTAGVYAGSATTSFVSHNSYLADAALEAVAVTLAGQVNNYADPRFVQTGGPGALASSSLLYVFDFGVVRQGAGLLESLLALQNAAVGPADLLRGSYEFDFGDGQDFGLFGFDSFSGLAAGQAVSGLRIAFDTTMLGVGTYDDTLRLLGVGYNASGYEGAFSPITLRIRGVVRAATPAPEPSTLLLLALGLLFMALTHSSRGARGRGRR